MSSETPTSPITIELAHQTDFASFTHRGHPGNRIGYRFFEHTPLVFGKIPHTMEKTGIVAQETAFSGRQGAMVYRRPIQYEDAWRDQVWTFTMAPAPDGIDLLWTIETGNTGLPRYYGVQQCFRLGGKSNADWRRAIAETPAFSEHDLWQGQANRTHKTSLTFVLRDAQWQALPAEEECVGARTPSGMQIDGERFGTHLPRTVGPYRARMLPTVDCGLITRTNLEGTWVCAIYWERTSHVTDHHPADCLHAIVNVGDLPPHSRHAIRGKIYWFSGTKEELRERWRRDFL